MDRPAIQSPRDPQVYYGKTMASAPAVVRDYYLALTEQNAHGLRKTLCDTFTFTSPMAACGSADDFVHMVGGFGGWVETDSMIVDGDTVAHTFTYHMTRPGVAEIPMCEVFRLRDGRIASARAYNNPSDFPA